MTTDRIIELTALVRAVELGSFSAAARELSVTASALSKIVTRLEARLGVRLVNRTSRSFALTAEGNSFVVAARRVLEAYTDLESELTISASKPKGKIRLYSLPTFAYRLVPLLTDFAELYPEVTVDVQLGTDRIDLVKYGFDLAIRLGPLENSGAFSRKICETEWIICASPEYLARHGVPQTPEHLANHNCLNFSIHTHAIPWHFKDEALRPTIRGNLLSNQAELLRLLALRGAGIIRVSDHVVADDLARGLLVPLLGEHVSPQRDTIWAIYRSRDHLSVRVRVFLDYLVERLAAPRRAA